MDALLDSLILSCLRPTGTTVSILYEFLFPTQDEHVEGIVQGLGGPSKLIW